MIHATQTLLVVEMMVHITRTRCERSSSSESGGNPSWLMGKGAVSVTVPLFLKRDSREHKRLMSVTAWVLL